MKPDFITTIDWQLLQKKYPDNMEEIIHKLNEHYPVQYLIGNVDFCDVHILVNESVLIPRFETELLVDKLTKRISKLSLSHPKIIDLGTGSGCIAIALGSYLDSSITGIDISNEAIKIAKQNAKINHVSVEFSTADMLTYPLEGYDVIVSNPPYVRTDEEVDLSTKYEPQNAIFAKSNGLYFYQELLQRISKLTNPPILIAFEIGMEQGEMIKKYTELYLKDYQCTIEKDDTGRIRYAFISKLNA